MGAVGGDPSVVEQEHPVGQGDRGHPVGHDERGGRHGAPQAGEDRLLDPGVDRRGGVVEEQQPRLPQQGPGEREALALAAGQRDAALADHLVEPVGEALDEGAGPGHLEGAPAPRRRRARRRG